jgi:hypothetical protein
VAIRRVPGNGSRVGAHAERDDAYTRLTTTSSLAGSETAWASSSTTTHASIVCGQNSGQIRGSLYLHLGQRLAAPPHPPIESTPRDPQSEGTPLAREHEREELHAGRNVARERENGVEDGCEEEENGGGGEVEGLEVVEEMTRDCRSGSAGLPIPISRMKEPRRKQGRDDVERRKMDDPLWDRGTQAAADDNEPDEGVSHFDRCFCEYQ